MSVETLGVVSQHDGITFNGMSATYSPEDNKLRLTSASRLDNEMYERVKAHGFKWAPKQQIFVAPMWTPDRADLLIELCGVIGDEDTSLVDRATERADRFVDYSGKRARDGDAAYSGVSRILDGIPFGQPILVGHHSERHARKDQQRIENGMRKAVQMWETSEYWTQRAAGALAHAKYKERPDVRARRIKTIEADKRKMERNKTEAEHYLKLWSRPDLTLEQAQRVADVCWLYLPRKEGDRKDFDTRQTASGALEKRHPELYAPRTLDEVIAVAKDSYPKTIAWADRWINHYQNRLAYERAMLGAQGGTVSGNIGQSFEKGGRVLVRGEWVTILRVNKNDGVVTSLRTNRKYVSLMSAEEVEGYEAPTEEAKQVVADATKAPPLCNYPGEGFHQITKAQWAKIHSDFKGTVFVGGGKRGEAYGGKVKFLTEDAAESTGLHRIRQIFHNKDGRSTRSAVYITDLKRTDPPTRDGDPELTRPRAPAPERVLPPAAPSEPARVIESMVDRDLLKSVRQHAKTGVQVVTAPQLFPTPHDLAARMVNLANVPLGSRILEPSAGTGAILSALPGVLPFGKERQTWAQVIAVELNQSLAKNLERSGLAHSVHCSDFLEFSSELPFDRILMNPPFAHAADIAHIKHALTLLAPGGRLVAVCANGPRQQDELGQLVEQYGGTWENLPAGTFEESGTAVNSVLIVIDV